MENKFKVGDKVVCIDNSSPADFLREDIIYIVKANTNFVYLKHVLLNGFLSNRFVLYDLILHPNAKPMSTIEILTKHYGK